MVATWLGQDEPDSGSGYGDALATSRKANSSIFSKAPSATDDWMRTMLDAAEREAQRRQEEEARKKREAEQAARDARLAHDRDQDERRAFAKDNADRFGPNTDNVFTLIKNGKQSALAWGASPEGQGFLTGGGYDKFKADEFNKDPYGYLAKNPTLREFNYGLDSPDDLAGKVPDDVQESLNFWFRTKEGEKRRQAKAGAVTANPVEAALTDVLPDNKAGRFAAGLGTGLAEAVPIVGPAIAGASGSNTDVSDPKLWAEGASVAGNSALLTGGGPIEKAIAEKVGPNVLKQLAGKAAFGAGSNAALAAAGQAATGEFDPQALGEAAALGGVMTAGPSALMAGVKGLRDMATNPAVRDAIVNGERGSVQADFGIGGRGKKFRTQEEAKAAMQAAAASGDEAAYAEAVDAYMEFSKDAGVVGIDENTARLTAAREKLAGDVRGMSDADLAQGPEPAAPADRTDPNYVNRADMAPTEPEPPVPPPPPIDVPPSGPPPGGSDGLPPSGSDGGGPSAPTGETPPPTSPDASQRAYGPDTMEKALAALHASVTGRQRTAALERIDLLDRMARSGDTKTEFDKWIAENHASSRPFQSTGDPINWGERPPVDPHDSSRPTGRGGRGGGDSSPIDMSAPPSPDSLYPPRDGGPPPPTDLSGPPTPGPGEPAYDPAINFLGLENADVGLTRRQRAMNAIRDKVGRGVNDHDLVTPIAEQRAKYAGRVHSFANSYAEATRSVLNLFKLDKEHHIILPNGERIALADLALDATLPGDRLRPGGAQQLGFEPEAGQVGLSNWERLKDQLSPEQVAGIEELKAIGQRYRDLSDLTGRDTTQDVAGYIPRGTPEVGGARARGRGGVQPGGTTAAEMTRGFATQAEGEAAGWTYPSPVEAARNAYQQLGSAIVDAHVAKQIKALKADDGTPLFVPQGSSLNNTLGAENVKVPAIDKELGTTAPGLKPLEGLKGPTDAASALNKVINIEKDPIMGRLIVGVSRQIGGLRVVGDFSDPVRTAAAALTHLTAAKKAYGLAAKEMLTEDAYGRYFRSLDPEMRDIANRELYLDPVGHPDANFFGVDLTRVPGYTKMSRLAGAYLNILRIESLKQDIEAAAKQGKPLTPEQVTQAAKGINTGTGAGSLMAGKNTPMAGLVYFPRWLGARMEFIAMAAKPGGGLSGHYARQAMLRLIGGGIVTAYVANLAQGKDTPWKDGVPQIYVPGIGFTSALPGYGALVRTLTKSSPISLDRDREAQNPTDAFKYAFDAFGGPIPSIGKALVKGKTPVGDDASWNNPEFWLRSIAPFSMSNIDRETFTRPDAALAQVADTLGVSVRTDRPTKFQAAANEIDQIIRAQFPGIHPPAYSDKYTLSDLNDTQKDALKKTPEYAAYRAKIDDAVAAKDEEAPGPVEFIKNAYATEKDRHAQALASAEAQFAQDRNGNRYRKNVADEQSRHIAASNYIEAQAKVLKLGRSARDYATGKMRDDLTVGDVFSATQPEDKAVAQYYGIYDEPGSKQADGTPNWDVVDAKQQAFLASLDGSTRAYVEQRLEDLKTRGVTNAKGEAVALPTLARLEKVKAAAKDFYAIRDTEFVKLQQRDRFFQQFDSYSDFLSQVQQAASEQGLQYQDVLAGVQKKHSAYRMFGTKVEKAQRKLRGSNTLLDYGLQEFYNKPAVNWKGYIANQYGDTQYDNLGPQYVNRSGPTSLQQSAFARRYGAKPLGN